MLSAFAIVHIVKITLLITVVVFNTIYIFLALIAHRSPKSVDILILNVCVACLSCACFWIVYNFLELVGSSSMRYDELCWFYSYAQNVSVCQVIYAFCAVSLNRYLMVIYPSHVYFKRRQWAFICIFLQWLLGGLLPLPLWMSKVWVVDEGFLSICVSLLISHIEPPCFSHVVDSAFRGRFSCTNWSLSFLYLPVLRLSSTASFSCLRITQRRVFMWRAVEMLSAVGIYVCSSVCSSLLDFTSVVGHRSMLSH